MSEAQLKVLFFFVWVAVPGCLLLWGFVPMFRRRLERIPIRGRGAWSFAALWLGVVTAASYFGAILLDQFGGGLGSSDMTFVACLGVGSLAAISGISLGISGQHHPKVPAIAVSAWFLILWFFGAAGHWER